MYRTCPKCSFKYEMAKIGNKDICPICGLIFSQWMKQQYQHLHLSATRRGRNSSNHQTLIQRIVSTLLYVGNLEGKGRFYGYLVIYLCFFFWGWSFILSDLKSPELNASFMHNINLVFHEAGHVIFRLFGNFIAILGGSLLQLIVPLIVILAFIFKHRDNFAASTGLWWLAQSMMDLVPYINDARAQEMWLLGGVRGKDIPGIHDWNIILSRLGLLDFDHAVASVVMIVAIGLMLLSFVWGAWLLKAMHDLKATTA
jgi:hypothetical protein